MRPHFPERHIRKSERKPAGMPKRIPPKKRNSPTYFRDNVPEKNYYFDEKETWAYKDKLNNVKNAIVQHISSSLHLVLSDADSNPRFTLQYAVLPHPQAEAKRRIFLIHSIQRERTTYSEKPEGIFWDAKEETERNKRFQKELNGMHPAEFLLSEFIYRHREEINKGARVIMGTEKPIAFESEKIYGPLIDRFFKKNEALREKFGFTAVELSPEKERVKAIIGGK